MTDHLQPKNFTATVGEVRHSSADIFWLELYCGFDFKAKPGQFVMLEPLDPRSRAYRPFSVIANKGDSFFLYLKNRGANTALYSNLQRGKKIKVRGPIGQPINFDASVNNYILVGGGMGFAGLIYPERCLHAQGKEITLFLGAKTRAEIFPGWFSTYGDGLEQMVEEWERFRFITEYDDSGRKTGLVTDLLEEKLMTDQGKSMVVACGPKPMLAEVARQCEQAGNNCIVLLEEMMVCGIGSCYGCAVSCLDESGHEVTKRVCVDGPAFMAKEINWPKFIPRYVSLPPSKKVSESGDGPLGVILGGRLALKSIVMNSAGCLDYHAVENGYVDIFKSGAIVLKSVEEKPSLGNPSPRVAEVRGGMLNSIGIQNVGIAEYLKKLPQWFKFGIPIISSIAGKTIEEYCYIVGLLEETETVGNEVNLGCPNVLEGGMIFGKDPYLAGKVIQRARQRTAKFLIAKLTPNCNDVVSIARAVVEAGADAISLINALQGMAIDPYTKESKIARNIAGFTGPSLLSVAVAAVFKLRQANLGVPIIGVGGITNAADAVQHILAGANAIEVGTAALNDNDMFNKIPDGLIEFAEHHKVKNIQELVGGVLIQNI